MKRQGEWKQDLRNSEVSDEAQMWRYESQGKRLTHQQHSVSTLYTEYSWQLLFAGLNLVSIWEKQVPTIWVLMELFIYLLETGKISRDSKTANLKVNMSILRKPQLAVTGSRGWRKWLWPMVTLRKAALKKGLSRPTRKVGTEETFGDGLKVTSASGRLLT